MIGRSEKVSAASNAGAAPPPGSFDTLAPSAAAISGVESEDPSTTTISAPGRKALTSAITFAIVVSSSRVISATQTSSNLTASFCPLFKAVAPPKASALTPVTFQVNPCCHGKVAYAAEQPDRPEATGVCIARCADGDQRALR